MMSKCGMNKKVAKKGSTEFVTDSLKSHFDIFYNLFLNKPTTTRNLFVLYKKRAKYWYW